MLSLRAQWPVVSIQNSWPWTGAGLAASWLPCEQGEFRIG